MMITDGCVGMWNRIKDLQEQINRGCLDEERGYTEVTELQHKMATLEPSTVEGMIVLTDLLMDRVNQIDGNTWVESDLRAIATTLQQVLHRGCFLHAAMQHCVATTTYTGPD